MYKDLHEQYIVFLKVRTFGVNNMYHNSKENKKKCIKNNTKVFGMFVVEYCLNLHVLSNEWMYVGCNMYYNTFIIFFVIVEIKKGYLSAIKKKFSTLQLNKAWVNSKRHPLHYTFIL